MDPEQDTPPVLDRYIRLFNPEFIGITSTPGELQPVYEFFGAAFKYAWLTGGSDMRIGTMFHTRAARALLVLVFKEAGRINVTAEVRMSGP